MGIQLSLLTDLTVGRYIINFGNLYYIFTYVKWTCTISLLQFGKKKIKYKIYFDNKY